MMWWLMTTLFCVICTLSANALILWRNPDYLLIMNQIVDVRRDGTGGGAVPLSLDLYVGPRQAARQYDLTMTCSMSIVRHCRTPYART